MKKTTNSIDLSLYTNALSLRERFFRLVWVCVWTIFARPLPRSFGNKWKILILRMFGAEIKSSAVVYSSTKVYMPWHLKMGEYSCLGPGVDCYNVAKISIGANSTVSQRSFLCSASHDIEKVDCPLIRKEICIEDQVWVAAEAFIGPGVTVRQGSVVGARASVFKDVPPWVIVGGNPAKILSNREIK